MTFFDELKVRGLIKQSTGEESVSNLLNGAPITFYIGFDPTAQSLHIGHLLQLITAKRLINAGHKFIALIGGATAMIGDSTGKIEMRKMLQQDDVDKNIEAIKKQIGHIIQADFTTVNNNDWFSLYPYFNFVRDIGGYFQVNNMLRADCFKARLANGGLSFLEFNYMLMQAFDFYHLHHKHQCVMQIGGDDQWSNILAGIDLTHKKDHKEVFGLTIPLLLNKAGEKMGKTVDGAIWLDGNKTSPFEFFQYWRNISDEDVRQCFHMMTHVAMDEIENIMSGDINEAKKRLAFEITAIVHSKDIAEQASKKAQDIFETDNYSSIEVKQVKKADDKYQVIVDLCLAESKTQARKLVDGGGIKWKNGGEVQTLTSETDFERDVGQLIVFKGKKIRIGCQFI